jgi:SAM-dependent methyltransferase
MDRREHWEQVWTSKAETETSWHQPEPRLSLDLIARYGGRGGGVLDVGGGSSRVVDGLLAMGASRVGVLDVSAAALEGARRRLGPRAEGVEWIVADVAHYEPEHVWDIWHDRAVFHFLTDPEDRQGYVRAARQALAPGGHVVVATFAPHGPTRCSGLEVVRYAAPALTEAFGEGFDLVDSAEEVHHTPWGTEQPFVYAVLRRG